ncbi:MAG: phosphoglycolate phosphatase [Magnetococcus sp. WYHC-3]
MTATSLKAVLFDLDGTLVDTSPDLCGALNHVLAGRGYPTLPEAQVRHLVGNGARSLLARGFWGPQGEPPQDDPDFESAVTAFIDYYRDHIIHHGSRPYPGVESTLALLKAQGVGLAVVTNKPEALALRLLDRLDLLDPFALVVGGDTLPQRKPHAAPLQRAMDHLGSTPASTVMVGDSHVDIHAARNAGCRVIAVSYGYHQGLGLDGFAPDRVVDHFPDMLDHLERD